MNVVGDKGSSETWTLSSSWCAQAYSRSVIIEMLIQWVRGIMHCLFYFREGIFLIQIFYGCDAFSRGHKRFTFESTCCKSVSFNQNLNLSSLVNAMFLVEGTNVSHLNLPVVNLSVSNQNCFHSSLVDAMLLFEDTKRFTFEYIPVVNMSVSNQNWFIVLCLMRCF